MKLKEIAIAINTKIHSRYVEFNNSTWCVQEMYWRNIYKEIDSPYHKIYIDLGESRSSTDYGKVLTVYQDFNFDHYFKLSDYEKKKKLLDLLKQVLLRELNESKQVIESAYEDILSKNIKNKWMINSKLYRSSNHKFYGGVECIWDIDYVYLNVLIYEKDKKTILLKKEIVKRKSSLGEFVYYLNAYWKNENFIVESKNNEKWYISLSKSIL